MFLFPDTCLLINFAVVNRIDLIEKILHQKVHWPLAIFHEVQGFSKEPEYSDLSLLTIERDKIYEPTIFERVEIENLRMTMPKSNNYNKDNLGEAEVLIIAKNRFPPPHAVIVLTEDANAITEAHKLKFNTFGSAQVLKLLVKMGSIDSEEALSVCKLMINSKRPILDENKKSVKNKDLEKWFRELK